MTNARMGAAPSAVRSVPTSDGSATVITSYGDPKASSGVVLCHGFIQNASAWAVPSRSLIEALVDDGHAVHALALRGREGLRSQHDLLDYVDEDVPTVLRLLAEQHHQLSWVGHSMGGLIGVGLDAPVRDLLRRVVVLGAPLIPGRRILRQAGLARPFRSLGRLLGARGRPFAGGAYGRGFVRTRAILERFPGWPFHLWRPGSFADDADLQAILANGFADDSYAVLADLADLIITNGTRAGRLPMTARLRGMSAPLLAIAGADDALAPPASVEALLKRCGSQQKQWLVVDAGHIDLIVGDIAPEQVWRPIRSFLATGGP